MFTERPNFYDSCDLTRSNVQLTNNETTSRTRAKLIGILRRVQCALVKTTVEPCLSLYMLSTAISAFAVQNMNLDKACRVNYAYGEEKCNMIMSGNTTGITEELIKIQSMVANVVAWKFPLQTAIPALMVLFVGAWSDRTRKRKICMLVPILGEMVTSIGLLLATYFMNEWSLETTALIEALPPAMTGGWIIMFMGMYSYMTDITTAEERTFRLGVVTLFITLGTPAGSALSGILLKALGYYGIFSLLLCLHAVAFIYGAIRLKDVEYEKTDDNNNVCDRLFSVQPVLDTVMVVCKKRPGSRRFQLFSVMLLYFLMVGPLYGDSQVAYLYARYKFNFSAVEYSLYSTFNVTLGLAGTLFCISILINLLSIEDAAIGTLAGASRIAACFVFTFAPTRSWYYSAPVFNIFSHTGLTAVRSMSSKLVPNDDVAKLSSLIGVCEAFAPAVYMPISSSIYVATLKTLPGAFYLFDASLTAVAVVFFIIMYCLRKNEAKAASTSTEDITNKPHTNRPKEVSTL